MKFAKTLFATAALAFAGAAAAAPTTVTEITAAPLPQVDVTISFTGGATYGVNSVVEYIVTSTSPAGTFAAFCLEPFQPLLQTSVYDNAGTFSAAQSLSLSKLFTGANWQSWDSGADGVTQGFQQVGLGLAVWDIMYDGTLDFAAGTFRVQDDGFNGQAAAFAAAAYNAGNASMAKDLFRLTDPTHQDLVIAVPEPTTYALMLAGLLSVGFVARRRSR